jgi:hypothetical protein
MTWNQPECDCGVQPGVRHHANCNALKPAAEQDPSVRIDSERQTRDED